MKLEQPTLKQTAKQEDYLLDHLFEVTKWASIFRSPAMITLRHNNMSQCPHCPHVCPNTCLSTSGAAMTQQQDAPNPASEHDRIREEGLEFMLSKCLCHWIQGPGWRRIMRLLAVCEKWLLAIWVHPYRHCRAPVSWVGRFCLARLLKWSSALSCLFSHSMDLNPLWPQGLWSVQ